MRTVIEGGTIVNEGRTFDGSIVIEDGDIVDVVESPHQPPTRAPHHQSPTIIDASGCCVLPGIIDDHVHFREPGLTEKADIESESRAAAAGGVTSVFDMPNTLPQTTSITALNDKLHRFGQHCHVNYSCFYGATNDNADTFPLLDIHRMPGIKLFMGSSTGNMLVDRGEALEQIFRTATLPIMAHCEDTSIINTNMMAAKARYGTDPSVVHHLEIRSAEACYVSTRTAVDLARQYGARLHVAHLTTARELELFTPHDSQITAEATVTHLFFSDDDYATLGTRIKCNPAVKTKADRAALRQALTDGRITLIGTDHAPHLLSQKEGGCAQAASGMPMVQFSLVAMLELVDEGVLSLERLVELMCHHPAKLFEVRRRGYIRPGYRADLAIVRPRAPWTVTPACIQSKCGWSPMEGHIFQWRVERTLCNGHTVYADGRVDKDYYGEEIAFR